jgi:hypothetical protein
VAPKHAAEVLQRCKLKVERDAREADLTADEQRLRVLDPGLVALRAKRRPGLLQLALQRAPGDRQLSCACIERQTRVTTQRPAQLSQTALRARLRVVQRLERAREQRPCAGSEPLRSLTQRREDPQRVTRLQLVEQTSDHRASRAMCTHQRQSHDMLGKTLPLRHEPRRHALEALCIERAQATGIDEQHVSPAGKKHGRQQPLQLFDISQLWAAPQRTCDSTRQRTTVRKLPTHKPRTNRLADNLVDIRKNSRARSKLHD